jgi:hypothetical protein
MKELETTFDCKRANFTVFCTYTLPIEEHVNELIEMTKEVYSTMDKR